MEQLQLVNKIIEDSLMANNTPFDYPLFYWLFLSETRFEHISMYLCTNPKISLVEIIV